MNLSRGARAGPTPESVKARLREIGVEGSDDYLDGIIRNIAVLQAHAATLDPFDPKSNHWLIDGFPHD